MIIRRPCKTNRIGQTFGQNLACEKSDGTVINAITDGICPTGSELLYPKLGLKGHNGYDMGLWHGEALYHCADWSGWMKTHKDINGGIGVDIISNEEIWLQDGSKTHVKVRYWHLKSIVGYDGRKVKEGQIIGHGDNTGLSSGDHLHMGLKKCDAEGNTTNRANGYYGAFDFTPYWENNFILDMIKIKQSVLTLTQEVQRLIYLIRKWIRGRDTKNG